MLAQLLRRIILTQIFIGAGLGYYVFAQGPDSWALTLGFAVGLPLFSMACSSLYSATLSRSGGAWTPWLRAVAGEFFAGTVIFLLRQPWVFKAPVLMPAHSDTGQKIPVVLVHGFLCNHRIWSDVAQALRAQGHSVIAVNLEPVFGSIEAYPSIIEAAVQQASAHAQCTRVVLVGHSMGGIAIRAWIRSYGSARAAGVVTLGSPHQGTRMARGPLSLNAQQMAWRSRWLKALAASESDAVRALFRIAITAQDNIVFPQRAQVLPGIQATVFEGIGHLQMCLARPVIDWVAAQVQNIDQQEVKP